MSGPRHFPIRGDRERCAIDGKDWPCPAEEAARAAAPPDVEVLTDGDRVVGAAAYTMEGAEALIMGAAAPPVERYGVTFTATVREWGDDRSFTVVPGDDFHEYPAVGETITVHRNVGVAAPPVEDEKYGAIDNRPWDAVPYPVREAGLRDCGFDCMCQCHAAPPVEPEHEPWCWRRHTGDCVDGPSDSTSVTVPPPVREAGLRGVQPLHESWCADDNHGADQTCVQPVSLRAAAKALLAALDEHGTTGESVALFTSLDKLADDLRAALLDEPVTLEVERLAVILASLTDAEGRILPPLVDLNHRVPARFMDAGELAEYIAARLTDPKGATDGE